MVKRGSGGCAASVWSSPIEGSPALLLGSGRWQARHLASRCRGDASSIKGLKVERSDDRAVGYIASHYSLDFVAQPTGGAAALPVCQVVARPHLPRRLPAPPEPFLRLLTAGREPVQIRTSDLGQPVVGTLWIISARYLSVQFPAGVRIAPCTSVSPIKMTATASHLSSPVMPDPSM